MPAQTDGKQLPLNADGVSVRPQFITQVDTSGNEVGGGSQSTPTFTRDAGPINDDLKAVPNGSTNGTPLGTKPASATGFIIYLSGSDSVTGTFASAQPGSAPANTVTRTASQVIEWPQTLGAAVNFYVTAIVGSPKFRWV